MLGKGHIEISSTLYDSILQDISNVSGINMLAVL